MILSTGEFLSKQFKMIQEFDEYFPQMNKIEKANEVGEKLMKHINENIAKLDEEAFESIDIESIKKKLSININENIDQTCLVGIYKEIEDSFNLQGRVSLSEYLYQGNVIYTGMLNSLTGQVDYSVSYTEEQLRERELEAADRFRMLLAFNTIVENADNITFSPKAGDLVQKYADYLDAVRFDRNGVEVSVNDKISEINYSLLALETFSQMGCKTENSIALNEYFSDKIKDLLPEMAVYSEDKQTLIDFAMLSSVSRGLAEKDSQFGDVYQEIAKKIELVQEMTLEESKENRIELSE